jgi:MFS superfamily sulfate permease-like transporter
MALSLRLPIFTSLRGYQAGWLRGDVVAGLTVWAVLVPEALAYASIAGVSPVVGLYAAPGALILYAAFGSSKHLVVGPMAATAALSAAAVGTVAAGNNGRFAALTATLAITTGILALAAGLARLAVAADGVRAVVLDAETVPFVDVTAARMLDELTADLHRRGVRLVIARDVGQVRDVLASSGDDAAPEYFPSVRAAVDAVRADAAGHVAGPTSTVKET